MPRKLDAGFEGRYLMSRLLMTSTMKSDPATPWMRPKSFGVAVSAAATRMLGGSAEGARAAAASYGDSVVAAVTAGDPAVVAAPATATPARNLRRLTSAGASFLVRCFRVMRLSLIGARRYAAC